MRTTASGLTQSPALNLEREVTSPSYSPAPGFYSPLRSHTHSEAALGPTQSLSKLVSQTSWLWWQPSTSVSSSALPRGRGALTHYRIVLRPFATLAVPALRGEQVVQQVVRQEFCLLQALGHELGILTPSEWIEICQQRCTLRRRLQRGPLHQLRGEAVTVALPFVAQQLAAAHVDSFPFSLTSAAGQVGMAVWSVPALLHCWLCKNCGH